MKRRIKSEFDTHQRAHNIVECQTLEFRETEQDPRHRTRHGRTDPTSGSIEGRQNRQQSGFILNSTTSSTHGSMKSEAWNSTLYTSARPSIRIRSSSCGNCDPISKIIDALLRRNESYPIPAVKKAAAEATQHMMLEIHRNTNDVTITGP